MDTDKSYCIPRDHLKSENPGSCKRSLDTHMVDSERKAAMRYIKKMPGSSRKEALLQCVVSPGSEPSLNKKRRKMDSSRCKKGGPHSAPPKSNHASVMRPVAAGISR